MTTNRCPDPALLLSVAQGDPDTPDLEAHVKNCAICRTEVDRLRGEVAAIRKSFSPDQTNMPGPSTWSLKPDSNPQRDAQPNSRTVSLFVGLELVPGYRLTRPLGKGAFAEVWEATGPGGVRVALKVLPLHGAAPAKELRALELMKDVRHPHLLALSAYWQIDSLLVIAMELADGTLWDRFQDCRQRGLAGIPAEELRGYLQDAADAIDFLNGARTTPDAKLRPAIQHRDIKPANLLLVGGRVKAGVFGLAKLLVQNVATHTGAMTVSYAAPECFNNQTTPFSDQYSLAATYCQLLGGRLPFDGPAATVMAGHLHGSPDLSMLPEAECDVVGRALAKKPEDRWPSCRAFVKALSEISSPVAPPDKAAPASIFNEPTQPAPPAVAVPAALVPPPPASEAASVKQVRTAVVFSLSALLGPLFIIESVAQNDRGDHYVETIALVIRPSHVLGLCFMLLALMGLLAPLRRTAYYYNGLLCALTMLLWAPLALLTLSNCPGLGDLMGLVAGIIFLCVAMLYYLSTRTIADSSSPRSPARWWLRIPVLCVLLLPIVFALSLLKHQAQEQLLAASVTSIVVNGLYLILPAARRNRSHWLPISFAVVPCLIAITFLAFNFRDLGHSPPPQPIFNNTNVSKPQGSFQGRFVFDGQPNDVVYIFGQDNRFSAQTLGGLGQVERSFHGRWWWNDFTKEVDINWDAGAFERGSVRWLDERTMEYCIVADSNPSRIGLKVTFNRR